MSRGTLAFPAVQWLLATFMGLTVGYSLVTSTTLVLGGVLAAASTWLAFYYPPFTVIIFWVVYALQTTVFAGNWSTQGLYYPVYALMAANAVVYLLTLKRQVYSPPRLNLLLYMAFYGVVLLGLAWQPPGLSVNIMQRLFIYALGILAAVQIRAEEQKTAVFWTMIATSLLVAAWTIVEASASGFAYRGGVGVNPNHVAAIIDLGLVPLFAGWAGGQKRHNLFFESLLWLAFAAGLYANLLLASRGVTAALIISLVIILMRRSRTSRQVVGVGLLMILTVAFLLKLPGSQNLLARLYETGVDPLNGRLQLWQAGREYAASSLVWWVLFGSGMGASEMVVRGVHSQLTSVHNAYLQVAIEYGFLGLILFTLLLYRSLWQSMRVRGHLGDTSTGIVIFLMIVSLTTTMADSFIFWIALGVTLPTAITSRRVI